MMISLVHTEHKGEMANIMDKRQSPILPIPKGDGKTGLINLRCKIALNIPPFCREVGAS